GGSHAFTSYELKSAVASRDDCGATPPEGHYNVAFQPGTNNQFLHVVGGRGSAAAPPPHAPAPAPVPGPAPAPPPGTSQAAFGCACVNNGVNAPIEFQFKWGN